MIQFSIPFAAVAKARARTTWTNQGPRHYTPDATRDWEKLVAVYAKQAMAGRAPLHGPVSLSVAFFMPVPPSWPLWKRQMALAGLIAHTTKPDWDNLEKGLADGCKGIAWVDDCQVVQSMTWKGYAAPPRVDACITPLDYLLPAQITRRPQSVEA